MENVVAAGEQKQGKVMSERGKKISAALTGKKWSVERKLAHSATMKEGREQWDKNEIDPVSGKRKGFKVGRPAVNEGSV